MRTFHPTIDSVSADAYTVPTRTPEADGTLCWDSTTLVLVEVEADAVSGLGYTYTHHAAAALVADTLAPLLHGADALSPALAQGRMWRALRNLGQPGLAACAISAVDVALWDLKAKLLDLPLVHLLGAQRASVPVYGSGGFTNYSLEQLAEQLGGWAAAGMRQVKMKVGTEPAADLARVRAARAAIGETGLFVDANGAYGRKQALRQAEAFAGEGVSWFEEPVSSNDLEGLRLLRDRAPAGMAIAAGEYAYRGADFRALVQAGAVDTLQVDATRCGGISGFLQAAALARACELPISAHTAPSLHRPLGCALAEMEHVEYFYDHVRIEQLFFDGAAQAREGALHPDLARSGLGLEFKSEAAAPYRH